MWCGRWLLWGAEAFPVCHCFSLTLPEGPRLASWLEISWFSAPHLGTLVERIKPLLEPDPAPPLALNGKTRTLHTYCLWFPSFLWADIAWKCNLILLFAWQRAVFRRCMFLLLMHVFSLLLQSKNKEFVSTTPYRLRKRLAGKDQPLQSASILSEALCSEERISPGSLLPVVAVWLKQSDSSCRECRNVCKEVCVDLFPTTDCYLGKGWKG